MRRIALGTAVVGCEYYTKTWAHEGKQWRLRYRHRAWQRRGGAAGEAYLYSDNPTYLREYAARLRANGQSIGLLLQCRSGHEEAP